ncbi:MAG: flagellar basal-body rod protein FlgF [Deltaproteobacteria bacterium]|nr:flagellar basal-body rod protein FlgF [Deltaproteobacteria bacterium]
MSGEISGILSGTMGQEMRLEVLSNNMANANTVGFKEDRVFRIPKTPSSVWNNVSGARSKDLSINNLSSLPVGSFTNFEQGQLKETGNALDVALDGEGFFSVQTPQGLQYTRKGNFVLNSNGTLVTQDGYPVQGKGGGEIRITGQKVVVASNGDIMVDGVKADTLKIVDFANKKGLLKIGNSLYSSQDPQDTGVSADNTLVQQGFIEASNVDPIKMMTEMIDVVRGYESYQKVLQSMNETNTRTNEIGKLS